MRKWTNHAKLFLAFSLISAASSCNYLPKSECGLTKTNGKSILGISVVGIDKNNSVFWIPKCDKSSRACGYIPQSSNEKGNSF